MPNNTTLGAARRLQVFPPGLTSHTGPDMCLTLLGFVLSDKGYVGCGKARGEVQGESRSGLAVPPGNPSSLSSWVLTKVHCPLVLPLYMIRFLLLSHLLRLHGGVGGKEGRGGKQGVIWVDRSKRQITSRTGEGRRRVYHP